MEHLQVECKRQTGGPHRHTDPSIYSALHHDTPIPGPKTKPKKKTHQTHKQKAHVKARERGQSLSTMLFRLALAAGGCASPALAIQQVPKQASSPTSANRSLAP
jgi:hypothetical protein